MDLEIRTYYEFALAGNDRYMINGETARPWSPEVADREHPTELDQRNAYLTHGYGLTLGPVVIEGLPVLHQDICHLSGRLAVVRDLFRRLSSKW
jgi:uncharacterized membrane protein (UPF0182 family)